MLDTLNRICEEAGRLLRVECALFEGNPRFVTAFCLHFEAFPAVFRAVAEDDTIAVSVGPWRPAKAETLVDAGAWPPWSACVGARVFWGWALTNEKGHTDGVRLEFCEPGEAPRAMVELVVMASAIQVYVVSQVGNGP